MKTTRIEYLTPGDTFEIPNLKGIMENGVFIHSTPAASTVIITEKELGVSKRHRIRIGNSVQVETTGKVELEKDELGLLTVKKESIDKAKKIKSAAPESSEPYELKQRGRKRIERNIVFPRKPFTVKDVAEKNNVEAYVINNEMTRLRKIGEKFEIVKTIPNSGGRGKPTNVWKLIIK